MACPQLRFLQNGLRGIAEIFCHFFGAMPNHHNRFLGCGFLQWPAWHARSWVCLQPDAKLWAGTISCESPAQRQVVWLLFSYFHLNPTHVDMCEWKCAGNKNRICAAVARVAQILFQKNYPQSADGQAGVPGFEPRSTAPKAGVLPLHHTPVRAKLYHNFFSFRPE
jgi:hypothetical protein